MKKITIMLMLLLLCMANVQASSANIKEYVEYSSGEKDDGSIYLDSYEDYEKILKNVDEQELYKTAYEQMIKEQIESFRKIRNQNDEEKRRALEYCSAHKKYMTDLHRDTTYFLKCNKEQIHNIKRRFKSAQIEGSEQNDIVIKIKCNKDEFMGWIMGQANKNILLIGPDEAIKTLKQKIKEISMLYEKEKKND